MKNSSYANRGQTLEAYIRYANDIYRKKNVAVICKQPTEFIPIRNARGQICTVKVEHKSTVDFIGRFRDIPIAIEAKESSTNSIRFDAVQPHQKEFMDDYTNQRYTIGLVVISLNYEKYYAIPWVFWKAAYEARVQGNVKSPVTVSAYGIDWTIPTKKSVRMDEIPPQFEVPGNDPRYFLHYLKNAHLYYDQSK